MTPTESASTDSRDLDAVLGPIWRRKWLLIAITVMSTVGAYSASSRQDPQFRSSTQVFVSSSQIGSIVGSGEALGTDRSTLDQANLLLSRPVSQGVIRRLGLNETTNQLLGTVSASPVTGSNFVSVTAERGSGKEAAAVANAYVAEYISYRGQELSREANAAIKRIRGQLSALPKSVAGSQQRDDLEQTIRQLHVADAASTSQSRQTDQAVAPRTPFTPKPKRDALFALVISLALSLALAFGLERFDRRIKRVDEIESVYDAPMLGSIPHATSPNELTEGKVDVPENLREPFRSLRSNIQLASLDTPAKRLVIASAVSGEGKSTVVRNLALTYREWGLSVVVLEADLRRPTLKTSFGVQRESGGLTSVLTGASELHEALIDIEVGIANLEFLDKVRADTDAAERPAGVTTAPPDRRLALLPAGETPPNPQAVLAADKMRRIINVLANQFDMILIDTPPLLAVSDAIPLLSQCDGVILVSRLNMTERPAARQAAAVARVDPSVRILGVVANDLAYQPGGGYGYGYGYGYGPAHGDGSSNGKKTKS